MHQYSWSLLKKFCMITKPHPLINWTHLQCCYVDRWSAQLLQRHSQGLGILEVSMNSSNASSVGTRRGEPCSNATIMAAHVKTENKHCRAYFAISVSWRYKTYILPREESQWCANNLSIHTAILAAHQKCSWTFLCSHDETFIKLCTIYVHAFLHENRSASATYPHMHWFSAHLMKSNTG